MFMLVYIRSVSLYAISYTDLLVEDIITLTWLYNDISKQCDNEFHVHYWMTRRQNTMHERKTKKHTENAN